MQKAKNIKLLKNNKAGRLILPDSKTYCKVLIIIKTL